MSPPLPRDAPKTVVFAFLDLSDGGAERLTLTACRHLDRARFRPAVLCVGRAGPLHDAAIAAGVPVTVLGRLRRPDDVVAVGKIARQLRACRADIVHVPLYSRASPYVRLAAHLAGVPLVVAHEWCRPGPPAPARARADRLLAWLAPNTRFVAASAAQRADLVAAGARAAAVEVVYLGIEVERFPPVVPAAARAALGLPPDRPIVLVPARLHPMKGHGDLLAAVAALRGHLPDVLVLCAGDGPLRRALPALVAAAGLGDAVRFLGPRSDIAALMGAADVVALASHHEGLPSVVMEAFAAERAVVATAVGGVGEAVRDDETGWLVPPHAPAALAGALEDALRHPAVRAARAARGRALVLARFQAADGARHLEATYDRWWAERPRRRRRSHGLAPAAAPSAQRAGREQGR